MRRGALAAVAASLVTLLLAPPAGASHDPSGEPFGEDFVTGSTASPFDCQGGFCGRIRFVLDAHSGASGEDPSGTVHLGQEFEGSIIEILTGPVVCLNVLGNRATVGADFSSVGRPDVFIFVEDNDGVGADRISFAFNTANVLGCPADPSVALEPTSGGDVTVHDGVPRPTSKEQCKDGGWRNFPGFKNQGECVTFVQRHPQP
jgi:hypothetical protein